MKNDARNALNSDGCWVPLPERPPALDDDQRLILRLVAVLGTKEALARLLLCGRYQFMADALMKARTPESGGQPR